MDNHYGTLGVGRAATAAEIRSAFLRLAKLHHPDANPGDRGAEARFKEVGAAYGVLSNALTRREHDAALDQEGRLERAAEARRASREAESAAAARSAGTRAPPGPPPRFDGIVSPGVVITLAEAFAGKTVDLDFPANVRCDACGGSGSVPAGRRTCASCGGTGSYWTSKESSAFEFTPVPCGSCGGKGHATVFAGCPGCGGRGVKEGNIYGPIPIPAGVPDKFHIAWATEHGTEVRTGFSVSPDKVFRRSGEDLLASRRLSGSAMARGTAFTFKGIDGAKLRVKVPPGTAPGTVLRVRGHGMSRFGRPGRGDLLIALENWVPGRKARPGT